MEETEEDRPSVGGSTKLGEIDEEEKRTSESSTNQPIDLSYRDILPPYWTLPLTGQLQTIHFWVFAPFFIFGFLRKKHISSNIRDIFLGVAGPGNEEIASTYASIFNALVPFAFLPSFVWGVVTDRFRSPVSMFGTNACACLCLAFSLIPFINVQLFTIVFYICFNAYVLGGGFAFCARVYGFATLGPLQGILSTMAGVSAIIMDRYWNTAITTYFDRNYFRADFFLLVLSLVAFLCPLYLILVPPPKGISEKEKFVGEEGGKKISLRRGFTFPASSPQFITTGQIFESRSLAVLQTQQSFALVQQVLRNQTVNFKRARQEGSDIRNNPYCGSFFCGPSGEQKGVNQSCIV